MSLIDEIARGCNREITERNTRIAVLLRRVAELEGLHRTQQTNIRTLQGENERLRVALQAVAAGHDGSVCLLAQDALAADAAKGKP